MKSNSDDISILVIDDHALTRFGLRTAVEAYPGLKLVAEAETSDKGILLLKKHNPEVVILNLGPPCENNFKTIKKIKDFNEKAKIIALASSNSGEEILTALELGVCAYCLKGITPARLIQVVDFVREGALWFDPLIAADIRDILLRKRDSAKLQTDYTEIDKEINEKPHLTERELDVLRLIVDGYSNAEISEKLCVSIHTSKAHVCNILHKLSVDDRTQAAIKALKDGII